MSIFIIGGNGSLIEIKLEVIRLAVYYVCSLNQHRKYKKKIKINPKKIIISFLVMSTHVNVFNWLLSVFPIKLKKKKLLQLYVFNFVVR